ncbi:ADP-ribosylglycohydrolase family protein [Nocardioides sp. zg-536]|uniref:ADP-ribosylglycohydrolase family protein n=1 Tax=Nocardioides faecalis TaxID=2803858 RepID=A0A938XYF1_9ACTN|nr:ADP-ribosylglycohydrolase family protein [Nocardioides faecalis]MBM9458762.1 ADP-ribosylglycohydrolase family protein [Nocardioides faecalis]QVI60180.1 ADP-ribosylglycohydrolase family protein [Nocardioides faecalis]
MQPGNNRNKASNRAPATWESSVRGLMLGLALGDAIGSRRSDIPGSGMLEAGAATQLAAWTAEGLMRTATRYGGHVVANPTDVLKYAYQRWALLRGAQPTAMDWHPLIESDHLATRGWLIDVPAMSQVRGSSPATMKALTSEAPTASAGCQALLRSLPIAALYRQSSMDGIYAFASAAASLTHDDGTRNAPTGFAVQLAAACLQSESFQTAFDAAIGHGVPGGLDRQIDLLIDEGMAQPCVPELLERLAPDKTAASALSGGIYVALSFPDLDTVDEALEFAGWAPDGDSVAAVAGAFLGAVHGFEAIPTSLGSRLELGWVMDALARDLARQSTGNQAGDGWKGDGYDDPLDPWWDTKYPGV